MVEGTNLLSTGEGHVPFDLFGLGFIAIIIWCAYRGIRSRKFGAASVLAGGLCFLWIFVGGGLAVSGAVLGYLADGWENRQAENQGREVRLYDGDTAPVEDNPDTEIPEHVYHPEDHAYIPCEWVDPRDREFGNCTQ